MGKKKKNQDDSIQTIFMVKPVKETNTALIRCVGQVNKGDNIADEPLICNDTSSSNKDDQYIYKITDTIYARWYLCHIRDTFLMTSKTLPVLYASIMYQTELLSGLLFNIFVDFTIETDIKSEKQLINTTLDGKYRLLIKINEKDSPKIIELDSFTGNKSMVDTIKTLIETDAMKSLIAQLIEERRKERQERFGSMETDSYCIPKPKYNFNQLITQQEENNKKLKKIKKLN